MVNSPLGTINRCSRFGIEFLYVYHSLVPKIIWLSHTEILLVQLSGSGVLQKLPLL